MRSAVRAAILLPFLTLGGCILPVSVTPNICRALQAQNMVQVRLMFGLTRHDGLPISNTDWNDFVAKDVTPRFPAGFTTFESSGQWLDTQTHTVTQEPSRIIWISTPETRNLQANLNAIRNAYKDRFAQQAVGLTIENGCAAF